MMKNGSDHVCRGRCGQWYGISFALPVVDCREWNTHFIRTGGGLQLLQPDRWRRLDTSSSTRREIVIIEEATISVFFYSYTIARVQSFRWCLFCSWTMRCLCTRLCLCVYIAGAVWFFTRSSFLLLHHDDSSGPLRMSRVCRWPTASSF